MTGYTIYKTLAERDGRQSEFIDYSWDDRERRLKDLREYGWLIIGTTEED